ncbi:MAG TPA: hypothetical protein VFF06_13060 [Polyangia bacterium]|nr:hypothetical protein [Polyangia bacterium]
MKARSPVLGYNHNVRYAGRLWHVQTEDSGVNSPHVFTHLFHDGTILATKRFDYDPLSEIGVVQKLMQSQHKAMLRELKAGVFDEKIGKFFGQPVVREAVEESTDPGSKAPVVELEAPPAGESEIMRLVGPPTDPSLQAPIDIDVAQLASDAENAVSAAPATATSTAAPPASPAPSTDPTLQPRPPAQDLRSPSTDPSLQPRPPAAPTPSRSSIPQQPPAAPPPARAPSPSRSSIPPPPSSTPSRTSIPPPPPASGSRVPGAPTGPRPTIPPPPVPSSTPSRTSIPPPPQARSPQATPRPASGAAVPRVPTGGIGSRRGAQTPPAGVSTRPTAEGVVVARPAVIIGGDSAGRREDTQPRAPGQPSQSKRWHQPSSPPTPEPAKPPPTSENIFGADLISEKSLDEVILAYLSEDLNEK